jgi:hypothetical protein
VIFLEVLMEELFDNVSRGMARGTTRRNALKLLGLGIAGTTFASLAGKAHAAPQTCVTCICGTGQPCNPKSTTCAEVRGFPAETTCEQACAKKNQNLCGLGQTFHCPHGCPA